MHSKKGFVSVRLGDGVKYMRFTNNVLAEVEDRLGVALPRLFADTGSIGFKALRTLIWAGVRGAGGKFSESSVGDMMDLSLTDHYYECVSKAFELAMPNKDKATDGEEDESSLDPI